MFDQERMNPAANGHRPSMSRGMRDLACDVISLAELQAKLLMVDLREGKSRLMSAAVLLGIGPVLTLAALPVMLLGLTGWMSRQWNWDSSLTQLALGLIVLGAGALVAWTGWRAMQRSFETLGRSMTELEENVRWVKAALKSGDRPHETHR
jgi:uncharacterized membrane protein YqjE